MKNFLTNNFFSVLFIGVAFLFTLVFINAFSVDHQENLIEVTVKPGDTVWNLAKKYKSDNMSQKEMINWIKKHNHLDLEKIKPGQTILLPNSHNNLENQLASK
ncbi:cell division suppressor protein YneA [Peribacillus tepidiphilus]|uniref:cell division suppressor protein YneA n=1 Tax=Peribacillus tepidiphilus TaxID=2652445 RepID=UPI001291DEBF|nr:LysM peptidoglycan-binding domain-containing protein [Peribacillus tepidiphilus]